MLAWWWCLAALVAVAKGQEFEAEAMQWSSLNVVVEPKAEECFYEVLKKGQVFEMDFEVGRGGLLDIEVVVTAPTMEIVHRKLSFFNHEDPEVNEKEGFLSLEARVEGQYMICFNNKMSRWTPKVVSFSVRGEAKAHPSLKQAVTVGKFYRNFV